MRNSTLIAAILAVAATGATVSAQERASPDKPPMAMEKEMPEMAPAKAAPTKPAMGMNMDKAMAPVQEGVKKMEQQMDAIHKTTDAKVRDKLMQEHMQTMEANMKAMRGMGAPKSSGMAGGDAAARQEMMEKRMDMMQTMLEQMMQRDKAMEPMPHM